MQGIVLPLLLALSLEGGSIGACACPALPAASATTTAQSWELHSMAMRCPLHIPEVLGHHQPCQGESGLGEHLTWCCCSHSILAEKELLVAAADSSAPC